MQLSDTSLLRSQCYINGEWVGDGGFDVTNPATGDVITSVPRFGADEARQAVEAAKSAMKEWAAKTAKERSAILRRWFDLQMENQEDLAQLMTAEQGKPLVESRGEVAYAASFTEFYAEEAKRVYGETIPTHKGGRAHRRRPPAGRRGGGDHAVELPARHDHPQGVGPALAAGCTIVCKPASETPLSAFALAVLAERAGVPAGVSSMWSPARPGISAAKSPPTRSCAS